tara:strand:+ start:2886 stop:3272 length:387 start_codon:yes stop_codon:yes gene_type:complete
MFETDLRCHFAGTVRAVEGDVVRAQGHTYVFNANAQDYHRRPEARTRIFALGDAQLSVKAIPSETHLQRTMYAVRGGRLVVSDGKHFSLDVNKFGATYLVPKRRANAPPLCCCSASDRIALTLRHQSL